VSYVPFPGPEVDPSLRPAPPPVDDGSVSTGELARLLRVGRLSVMKWGDEGKLRFYTAGRSRRYPKDVVDALLEGRLEDAAP
jgi:excisionase family DNA binding protein